MFRGDFFDFDPVTGVTEYYEEHADGTVSLHSYQDVAKYKDIAAELRNNGSPDEVWKKQGASLYAVLPPVVQAEMFKKGINFLDPNDTKRVVDEINQNYPALKTTYKHHALPR